MANQAYEVQGTVVNTLKEVSELLGEKVTGKDIKAGKYEGVTIVTADQELDLAHKDEFAKQEVEDHEREYLAELQEQGKLEIIMVGDAPDKALTNTEDTDTALTNTEEVDEPTDAVDEPSDNQLEYPEVGAFDSEKAIKKYIKALSNEQLAEWVELEGVEYKANDHESINRMRQAMAIKALHFPDTAPKAGSSKKKSKYSDYTTEQLVEMALDNDVEVRDDKGDPRILRMYTIMALKAAGLLG